MKRGADRLCMPSPSPGQFVNAVKQIVIANKRWVPPPGKGSLYIRPLLIGTGALLGVAPAPEYTFLIYCSPVGSYQKGALNLKVEDKLYRAISGCGGTGGIKSVTNYAPVYTAMADAKANGFSDVLFLDSATGKHIEEASACNVFVLKDNAISTPAIDGTILPGITRKSIIDIAIDLGYQVMERSVSVEEMLGADEMFCTGTAVVVNSVASVTYKETRVDYKTGPATLSSKLRKTLVGIQTGAAGENYADINWDNYELGFYLVPTDYMYVMKCAKGDKFSQGSIVPYGNIEISPSAGILNYGQGLFEGLKAYRTEDGRILLFRPDENAQRMKRGADRLCMPSPSNDQFVNAVKQIVLANKRWVPPSGKGSLYVRPLLMGTGASLGVGPAPEYTFLIYCSPVGSYHKGALNFKVEDKLYRAISGSGGTGGIKSVTNYAPVYTAMTEAKANGFSDVLFLDSATGKYIEEATACNVFVVKDNSIFTPEIDGTILPGITRKSIIEIAIDLGYQVMERAVSVEEMLGADEMFCTGTAMVVNSVASVTYKETRVDYKTGPEALSAKLRATLVGIQTGCVEDKKSWTVLVD
ncbi:putative branched-chain-amino-acid aminotransferase 7 [Glycine soja]